MEQTTQKIIKSAVNPPTSAPFVSGCGYVVYDWAAGGPVATGINIAAAGVYYAVQLISELRPRPLEVPAYAGVNAVPISVGENAFAALPKKGKFTRTLDLITYPNSTYMLQAGFQVGAAVATAINSRSIDNEVLVLMLAAVGNVLETVNPQTELRRRTQTRNRESRPVQMVSDVRQSRTRQTFDRMKRSGKEMFERTLPLSGNSKFYWTLACALMAANKTAAAMFLAGMLLTLARAATSPQSAWHAPFNEESGRTRRQRLFDFLRRKETPLHMMMAGCFYTAAYRFGELYMASPSSQGTILHRWLEPFITNPSPKAWTGAITMSLAGFTYLSIGALERHGGVAQAWFRSLRRTNNKLQTCEIAA